MWIYYLLLTASAASAFCLTRRDARGRGKAAILYLTWMGLLLTAVASLRYAIGFDYASYRDIYAETAKMGIGEILGSHAREFLFYLLCKASAACGLSYPAFLTAVNLFIHGVAMWFFYRYSRMPWLSIHLYVTLQFLAHNMNLVRQSMAVAFFLLAFPYLAGRRILPFAAIMAVGGFFHNSLFLILPFYFLLPVRSTAMNMAMAIAGALALYLFTPAIFDGLKLFMPAGYSAYAGSRYWQGNSFRYAVLPFAYFLLVLPFRRRLLEDDPMHIHTIYLNSALYTALINLFITRHFILERFAAYPFILSTVLIPDIVCLYRPALSQKPGTAGIQRKTALVPALFLLFSFCYFGFAVKEGFHHVYPYVGLWDRAASSSIVP